jgi:dihydrolipoamide dehydrogenase
VHDSQTILSYKEAMAISDRPRRLLVIGAGAVGIEFAYFYAVLGTKVIVVEALGQILPVEDEEVATALARSLTKLGIDIHTSSIVEKIEKMAGGGVKAMVVARAAAEGGDRKAEEVQVDRVLLAVGVRGNVEGLGLEEIGVKTDRGFIAVERPTYRTSVEGVYAIGDVVGPPMLAHKASAEGIACVERLAGIERPKTVDYDAIPGCTYCRPEVASVGLTEKQARERGEEFKVGRFPLKALGKARAAGETEGFVKVLVGRHGELVGAHLLGGDATDLVAELGLMKAAELTTDEALAAVHAHPTFAEAVKEALADATGEAIDI